MGAILQGVKILDLGMFMAGPYSDRILADLGADVIKIEEFWGDPMRANAKGTLFIPTGKGKRSLALDLRKPEGLEVLYRMIPQVDIFHHNFRVGSADRIGIGYEKLISLNPRLIYCHTSGYGMHGPLALAPTFEPLHSGVCGMLGMTGGEGNAPATYLTHMDYGTAVSTVTALLMALIERLESGKGQFIETPQMVAAMTCTSDAFKVNGKLSKCLMLDGDQMGHGAAIRLFRTSDGMISVACHLEEEWAKLCNVLGLPGLINDDKYNTSTKRRINRAGLDPILEEKFAAKSTAEWSKILDESKVPNEVPAPYYGIEFLNSEDRVANGQVAEYVHPEAGLMREVGATVRFSETPMVHQRPSPTIGQQSEEVLLEYGFTKSEIAGLFERKVTTTAGKA